METVNLFWRTAQAGQLAGGAWAHEKERFSTQEMANALAVSNAHGHYSAAPPGGPRPGAALRGIQFHRRTQAPGLERLSRRAVRCRGRHHSAPCQPGGCGSLRPGDAHANPHSGLYAYARLFSGARRVHQRAVRGAAPAIGFGRRPVHSRHHRQRADIVLRSHALSLQGRGPMNSNNISACPPHDKRRKRRRLPRPGPTSLCGTRFISP